MTNNQNIHVLKDMEFEKVGHFIRFGVVEINHTGNDNSNSKEDKGMFFQLIVRGCWN